jgi:vitamin B12 transporter
MKSRNPVSARMVLALVVGLGPVGLWAQAPVAQAPEDTAKQKRPVVLKEVVVTATRVPVPAVTAAATVLEGDELRGRGVEYVLDALREVPGATVVQTGSFGGITSLFLRGGNDNFVRVLIDGVPVNEPGGAFDFANLTTENVERIEIVRGPASVLYGSDAVTGVVQIFTRRGGGEPRATASVRGGTYGTTELNAGLLGRTGPAGYSVDVAQVATDGIYAFNNHYRHTQVSGLVHFAPDKRTEGRLSLRYSDDNYHIPTDFAGQVKDHDAFQFGEQATLGLELGRFFSPRVEGRLLLASNATDGGFDDRQDGPGDTLGFYAFKSLDAIRRRSVEGRTNVYLPDAVVVTVGAQIEQEKERSFNESQSQFGPSNGSFDVRRTNRAAYLQALRGAVRGLALNLGVRLDDNDAFGTFATYRGGVAYRLPSGTGMRAAFGTGFREPTFFENFAQGFVTGNPNLHPERSRSWEAGLDQELGAGRVSLSATYFHQRFRDLIDFTFSPPSRGAPNYFNIAAADADGVEVSTNAATPLGVSVGVSYTYLRTRVTNPGFDTSQTALFAQGDRLLRRPTHAASLRVGYGFAGRGTVHAVANYVGDRDDLDFTAGKRVTLPPYTTIDLAAEYDLVAADGGKRALTVSARLTNALDKQYAAVAGFPSPGRSLLVGVRVGYGL